MVKVTVSNNLERKQVIVSEETTVMNAFREADIDPTGCTISLNGIPVLNVNASLQDIGANDESHLRAIIKLDNA